MSSQSFSVCEQNRRYGNKATMCVSHYLDLPMCGNLGPYTHMYVPTLWEPHYSEDSIQLVVVVGTAGLHILLPAVEDGFKGQ